MIPYLQSVESGKAIPWVPFLFAICHPSIHPALIKASEKVDFMSYMDDIYLVGKSGKMPSVIQDLAMDFDSIS